MMKRIVKDKTQDEKTELTFFEKYKTDKRYKAKVELIGYGVLILVLIVYLNISSMNSSPGMIQNVISDGNFGEEVEQEDSDLDGSDLLKKIDNNYEYDVQVSFRRSGDGSTEEEDGLLKVRYFGKRNGEYTLFQKESQEGLKNYYKMKTFYFVQEEDGVYDSIEEDVIYDEILSDFIEFDGLLKYLEKGSLDHVTNYSTGKKEYVYHLKVKDVMNQDSSNVDMVEFYVLDNQEELSVSVDYSVLMKAMDLDISFCEVQYIFKNIGNVEEFEDISVVTDEKKILDETE